MTGPLKASDESQDDATDLFLEGGPLVVDNMLRQSFSMCWLAIPKNRRTSAEVVRIMREIFERTVKAYEEDSRRFLPEGQT